MHAYCVAELHLAEAAAFKRIHAARTARRFPAIFGALADGRLHLSAVVLLAPHLTEDTADELLAAATHQSKPEVERLLAARFPRPDLLSWVEALPGPAIAPPVDQHAPGRVEDQPPAREAEAPLGPQPVTMQHAPCWRLAQDHPPVARGLRGAVHAEQAGA